MFQPLPLLRNGPLLPESSRQKPLAYSRVWFCEKTENFKPDALWPASYWGQNGSVWTGSFPTVGIIDGPRGLRGLSVWNGTSPGCGGDATMRARQCGSGGPCELVTGEAINTDLFDPLYEASGPEPHLEARCFKVSGQLEDNGHVSQDDCFNSLRRIVTVVEFSSAHRPPSSWPACGSGGICNCFNLLIHVQLNAESVDCSNSGLFDAPSVANLPAIQSLALWNNFLTQYDPSELQRLDQLKELNIDGNLLSEVPVIVNSNLIHLMLANNREICHHPPNRSLSTLPLHSVTPDYR